MNRQITAFVLGTVLAACGADRSTKLGGGSGITSSSGSDTDSGDTDSGGTGPGGGEVFDVFGDADLPGDNGGDCSGGGSGGDGFDFSYIWIANSPEGTVSKIDTVMATEVARYRTGPGAPDPSRTSVNLEGDVAVLNRTGSVSKIAATLKDCTDANGNGIIETSSGPADILTWGADECVVWHTELDYTGGGGASLHCLGRGRSNRHVRRGWIESMGWVSE